jgi:hypothetical protein
LTYPMGGDSIQAQQNIFVGIMKERQNFQHWIF